MFPLERMQEYTQNYISAGGHGGASPTTTPRTVRRARFARACSDNVVFAQHNLVTDGSFNEFHLILCRNVMIYFSTPLQGARPRAFYDSLRSFGVLGPGSQGVDTVHPARGPLHGPPVRHEALPKDRLMARELVVIGCSKGGARTLPLLLADLPPDFPAAVAAVQHRGPELEVGGLASFLDSRSALPLREAEDNQRVEPGVVHLAPADYHLLVEGNSFALSTEAPLRTRPPLDRRPVRVCGRGVRRAACGRDPDRNRPRTVRRV